MPFSKWPPGKRCRRRSELFGGCGGGTFHAMEDAPDAKRAQAHAMVERGFAGGLDAGMDTGSLGSATCTHQPESSFGRSRQRRVHADHPRNGLYIRLNGGVERSRAGGNL